MGDKPLTLLDFTKTSLAHQNGKGLFKLWRFSRIYSRILTICLDCLVRPVYKMICVVEYLQRILGVLGSLVGQYCRAKAKGRPDFPRSPLAPRQLQSLGRFLRLVLPHCLDYIFQSSDCCLRVLGSVVSRCELLKLLD